MKKLLVSLIGLGLVLGTVSFAQDTTSTKKVKKSKKKKGADTTATTK
jgi:hypothetical protein